MAFVFGKDWLDVVAGGFTVNFHKHSVFNKWFLTNLTIVLLTLSISIFTYSQFIRVVRQETTELFAASISHVQNVMDENISSLLHAGITLSFDSKITTYLDSKKPRTSGDSLDTLEIIRYLKSYQIANPMIEEIYLSLDYTDTIVSSKSKYTKQEYFDMYYSNYDLTFEMWKEQLSTRNQMCFSFWTREGTDDTTESVIFFTASLPLTERNNKSATLVIVLDAAALSTAVRDLEPSDKNSVLMIDSGNNIIVNSANNLDSELIEISLFPDNNGVLFPEGAKKRNPISYAKSTLGEWYYISLIPPSVFTERVDNVYHLLLLCVIFILLFGVGSSLFLARKNYTPLKKLVYLANGGLHPASNEFDLIESSIQNLRINQTRAQSQLDRYFDRMREAFLSSILSNPLEIDNLEISLKQYDIQFTGDSFWVVIYCLGENRTTVKDHLRNEKAFKTFAEQHITHPFQCYFTEISGHKCLIINSPDDLPEFESSDVVNILERMKHSFFNTHHVNVSFSVSEGITGIESLPSAYQQAVDVEEYQQLYGLSDVLLFDRVFLLAEDNIDSFTVDMGSHFINLIKANQLAEAKEAVRAMIADTFLQRQPSMQIIRCKLFGLIGILLSSIQYFCNKHPLADASCLEKMILESKTISDIETNMIQVLSIFEEVTSKATKTQEAVLFSSIKSYIHDNFSNPELSVSNVAEKVNMNVSTISKFFKAQSGIGMLEYIHLYRIEQSKVLMKEHPELSIKEISDQVGFYNSSAFIRVFKKYNGITPGKYL